MYFHEIFLENGQNLSYRENNIQNFHKVSDTLGISESTILNEKFYEQNF